MTMKRRMWAIVLAAAVLPLAAQVKNEDCLACHAQRDLEASTPRGRTLNLFVGDDPLKGSSHEGFACTDCHIGARSFDDVPHAAGPLQLACAGCHEEQYRLYREKDIHGKGNSENNPRAPYCNGCHGGHDIRSVREPGSIMSRQNQPRTCGRCHGSEKLNLEEGITKRNLIARYESSVHWQAIRQGKAAASCTDCHGFHTVQPSSAFDSSISPTGIVATCVPCHASEVDSFKKGPHGVSVMHGNHDVPTCTTCHGDHDMASLRSRVGDAKRWAATQVCIWCHGNARMMARYGLDTTPVDSYMQDFHGLTQRGTMGASATCADCHDAHSSLPASHPQSRMHLSNRGSTCGQCHGQVSPSFAQSFSHRKALQNPGRGIEGVVRFLYIALIVACVAAMLAYNLLIWFWAVRRKFRVQKAQQHIRRLTRFEVWSHMALFLSFTLLVITGFALKYPDAFWVRWLFSLGMTETVRAFLHRLAALIMVADMAAFGFYMLLHRRGRVMLGGLMPRRRDWHDVWASVRFYAGGSQARPQSDLFSFVEKFEFWALVWGVIIMGVTGLILWFPRIVPGEWPAWVFNVARIIHFYEAVLASLAILIWHGFHTIWHPDEYPMNTSWLTGYITAEEAGHRFEDRARQTMEPVGDAPAAVEEKPPTGPDAPEQP